MEQLDKVEEIVARTEANYEQAVKAFKQAEGDLEAAISAIGDRQQKREEFTAKEGFRTREEFEVKGEQLKEKVRELIKQSGVTRLKIKQGNRTMLDIPVAAGVIGTVISPYLAAAGALAAMVTKCSIEVERAEQQSSPETGIIDKQQEV